MCHRILPPPVPTPPRPGCLLLAPRFACPQFFQEALQAEAPAADGLRDAQRACAPAVFFCFGLNPYFQFASNWWLGLVVWRFGGLEVWWFGGLVVWGDFPFTLYKSQGLKSPNWQTTNPNHQLCYVQYPPIVGLMVTWCFAWSGTFTMPQVGSCPMTCSKSKRVTNSM